MAEAAEHGVVDDAMAEKAGAVGVVEAGRDDGRVTAVARLPSALRNQAQVQVIQLVDARPGGWPSCWMTP